MTLFHRYFFLLFLLPGILFSQQISEQIIIDQFGWRPSAPTKIVIFSDPIQGQHSAVSCTPGSRFLLKRSFDNLTVFTGVTVT